MRDGFDIEGDLTANNLINIDLEVSVSDALSYVDIIEGIKGQENEIWDDNSNNEQQTELLTKLDIKDVMDAVSIYWYEETY